jgi:hypothetical protein
MKEWSNEVMEYWSIGKNTRENPAALALTLHAQYSNTPILQYSNWVLYVEP